MSRIYEALQRAEIERKVKGGEDNTPIFGDLATPSVGDQIPVGDTVDFENVAGYSWAPSMMELPALADRGKCVEQFRSLRSNLQLQRLQQDFKSILVTSGLPGEGKTFIAANLALSLAQNSERGVLLVDADLRRPAVHRLFGTSVSPGLADYLEGNASIREIIQRRGTPKCAEIHERSYLKLALIPAGACRNDALELVSSRRIDELMSEVSLRFDWIVLDSPPVLAVSDAVDLARVAGAVLLVAHAGSTPYSVAQKVQQAFGTSKVLGFVLNAVKGTPRSDSYYSYYYDEELDARRVSHGKRTKRNRE